MVVYFVGYKEGSKGSKGSRGCFLILAREFPLENHGGYFQIFDYTMLNTVHTRKMHADDVKRSLSAPPSQTSCVFTMALFFFRFCIVLYSPVYFAMVFSAQYGRCDSLCC